MRNCWLCGGLNLNYLETEKAGYYFCQDCELIFLKKEAIVSREEEKARYEEHDNSHDNIGYVTMFEKFIEKVIIPNDHGINSVLDFGCGPVPVLADLLKERGYKVDIYDPFFFPKKNYDNQSYDLITSTEVFEHLHNPVGEIKKLYSCLGKGGFLAIMTSFHPGPEKFVDWWYKWDPTHVVFYNSITFDYIANMFSFEKVLDDGEKYCLLQKK